MPSYIAPEILEEIISRTDIVEVVSAYVPLRKMGRNYVGLCPFHDEDTPSFTVSPDKQIFYCFGCQKGGNALHFLMEEESLTLVEAGEKLASRCGVKIPEAPQTSAMAKRTGERQSLLRIHDLAADFYRKKLKSGNYPLIVDYLRKRGISEDTQEFFNLGYAPGDEWSALSEYLLEKGFSGELLDKSGLCTKSPKNGRYYDKFHGRIIFPIGDPQGQFLAFGGRIVGDEQPKYLNSSQTLIYNKSRHLYGLKNAAPAIRKEDMAVIVEGYLDVISCYQQGVKNAVAPLGTAFTTEQASLLKRYTHNVLLAFDGDSAGLKAAAKSIDILRECRFNIKVMMFPDGMDPDEFLKKFAKEGWEALARKALNALDFLYEQAKSRHPGNNPADKGLIVTGLLPQIAKTASNVERSGFITFLSEKLGVDESAVYADLRKSGYKIAAGAPKKTCPGKNSNNSLEYEMLRLLLEDKQCYEGIRREVADDFFKDERSLEIIAIAAKMMDEGNFSLALIMSYLDDFVDETLENEEKDSKILALKQFLLKILQIELPFDGSQAGKMALLREYIKAYHIFNLENKIAKLTTALALPDQDTKALLEEITLSQHELQSLKGEKSS